MKKLFFAITMLFAGCVQNFSDVSVNVISDTNNDMTHVERAKRVVLKMLNQIDSQTRGSVREIASVEVITFDQIFKNSTRSDSSATNPTLDSLIVTQHPALYIVNLEDNEGTAVVEVPVFIGGEQTVVDTTSTNDGKLLFITDTTLGNTDKIISDGTNTDTDDTSGSTTLGPDISEQEQFLSSLVVDYLEKKYTNDGGYTEDTSSNSLDELCSGSVGPLLTTLWHQDMPFNAYLPEYYDEYNYLCHYLAGCATIAVAQFLVYTKDISLSDVFNIENFTWDTIEHIEFKHPYEYYFNPEYLSQNNGYCLANLIKQIGDGIGVTYGKKESTAKTRQVKRYLSSLGYNVTKYNLNNDNKYYIINSLLHYKRPVIMRGQEDSDVGHMWLIDGYRLEETCSNDYYLHCNYGWNAGAGNGWYYWNLFNSKKDNKRELDDVKEKDDFNYNSYCQFLIVE